MGIFRPKPPATKASVAANSSNIEKLQNGLAIIVDGDTCSTNVAVGRYAYIKNNTHGLADGLYTNTSSSVFPTSGGTADSTVFTSVSDGGLNKLTDHLAQSIEEITITFESNFYCETDYKLRGYKMTKPDGTGLVVLSGDYKTSVDMTSGEHKIATMSVTATGKVQFPTGQYTKANDNGLYINASITKYVNNHIYTGVFTI